MNDSLAITDLIARANEMIGRSRLSNGESLNVLREPEFEEFLNRTSQAIIIQSKESHVVYASLSFASIIGHPLKFIYEKGLDAIQQIILPKDRQVVEKIIVRCFEALNQSSKRDGYFKISFDYHLITGAGSVKRIFQHFIPGAIRYDKNFVDLYIMIDVTGFKSSKALNFKLSHYNESQVSTTLLSGEVSQPAPYRFTRREEEILKMLVSGTNMKEIAGELSLSDHTIKRHRANILLKSGAANLAALVSEGIRDGWLNS